MGLIREPEGVDFVIQSKPLTEKQGKKLSEFIANRKIEIKRKSKKIHTPNNVSHEKYFP